MQHAVMPTFPPLTYILSNSVLILSLVYFYLTTDKCLRVTLWIEAVNHHFKLTIILI